MGEQGDWCNCRACDGDGINREGFLCVSCNGAGQQRSAVMGLSKEREAELRAAAHSVEPVEPFGAADVRALLAEIDAVRAERDALLKASELEAATADFDSPGSEYTVGDAIGLRRSR